jgi:predicted Zn-dependent protease
MTRQSAYYRLALALALVLGLSVLNQQEAGAQQPSAAPSGGPATSPAPQDGVPVAKKSRAIGLASAEEVERSAAQQYEQMKRQAAQQNALAPDNNPQLQKLRAIAQRIIPFATRFNERAPGWRWEVNLIGSKQINAFCMPGGKIAFYTGIIDNLKLTDDEIAIIMGHEIAHALQEHGRERVGKERLAQGLTIGASVLSSILGYGDLGGQVAGGAARLTLLKYSRDDESEADIVGMDIAARAGFDPRAGVILWQKMAAASGGNQPPQFVSTHPSHKTRINEIQAQLKVVMPLYAAATKRSLASLPPYRSNFGEPVQ